MPKKKNALTNREIEDIRVAAVHEAVHAAFFNREPVNVREVRARLDPLLQAQEIREIMKINLSDKEEV